VGDRVRFTAADKSQKIINGERGTVTKIENGLAFIALDSGAQASVSLDKDATVQLRYAYAQTGHSAQGATAKMFDQQGIKPNVILCTNANDATVDAKSWYTNLTRAADKLHMVTNAATARQIENIRKSISHSKEKDMAFELLEGKPEPETKKEERAAYIAPAAGDQAWHRIEFPAKATSGEISEILKTAQAQYGRELFVSGPVKFQSAVAKIAGKGEMDIKFDDKELDKTRKAATAAGIIAGLKKAIAKAEPGTIEHANMVLKLEKLQPQPKVVQPTPAPVPSPIQQTREAVVTVPALPGVLEIQQLAPSVEQQQPDLKPETDHLDEIHQQIDIAKAAADPRSMLAKSITADGDHDASTSGTVIAANQEFVAVHQRNAVKIYRLAELSLNVTYDGIDTDHGRFAPGNEIKRKNGKDGMRTLITEEREHMQIQDRRERDSGLGI